MPNVKLVVMYARPKDIEAFKKSADKMSEENYSFRTTPQVRTYGEMIAHIADTQIALCSMVKGEPKKGGAASKTSKIDLSAAPFDYCDPVYDSMTDAEGA